MTQILQVLFLGVVQGITEFLPISSTGHLILLEKFFGISQGTYGLAFDAALHLGTLLAILWFFRKTWFVCFTSILRIIKVKKIETVNEKLAGLLVVGTIPAMVFGVLLEKKAETVFRSEILVAAALILFSLVLIYVERTGKKNRTISQMSWRDSILIGFFQAIALIPGVSRSGITIAAGMWEGLTREDAARFTFLLSAPIIAGAGSKKLFDTSLLVLHRQLPLTDIGLYIIGMLAAAVFGYLTIKYFLKYLSRNSLMPFIIYRLVLGSLILALLFLH